MTLTAEGNLFEMLAWMTLTATETFCPVSYAILDDRATTSGGCRVKAMFLAGLKLRHRAGIREWVSVP